MKSLNITFGPAINPERVTMDLATYEELRRFAITHGETDLPAPPMPVERDAPEIPTKKGQVDKPKD